MAGFYRWIPALAVIALVLGLPVPASAQAGAGLVCTASAPVIPTLRHEGYTELTGDIVLTCTGAQGSAPTQPGDVIPQANFSVALSGPVTSRTLGTATEALLLVDDPSPANQDPCPSPTNPQACQVQGDGGQTFNQPGRFNVFQGLQASQESATFLGVPVDPPAPGPAPTYRTFRITNVRVDATAVAGGQEGLSPVYAFVSTSSSSSIQINSPQVLVGFVSNGLTATTAAPNSPLLQCMTYTATPIGTATFTEDFATAFKIGTSGVQNIPGQVYYSESGLEIAVNGGTAGLANYGTMLQTTISNIPAGVTISVDNWAQSPASTGCTNPGLSNNGCTLISDASIVNGVAEAPDPGMNTVTAVTTGTQSSVTVAWEVTHTNSSAIDSLTFRIYASFASAPGSPASRTATTALSGFSPQFASYSSGGPIPEFSSTVNVPAAPTTLFTVSSCPTISGQVTLAGNGLSGVAMALSGSQKGSTATNASGSYSFTVAAGGTYTVTPSLTGYAFNPLLQSFSNVSGSQMANFAATIVPALTSLSPNFAFVGSQAVTLTATGFGFVQCAVAPCLGINWQPAAGGPTLIPAQANANGTQLTATIPESLIAAVGTATINVRTAGGTSNSLPFIIAGAPRTGGPISTGHLLFPNVGINALQEFDPVTRSVVNTITMPAPFTYFGSDVIETVRIRQSDGGILTNAVTNGDGAVVALSDSGQFVAAEQLTGAPVQELAFDPLDSTQSTVLAGSSSSPNVIAINPYGEWQNTRITQEGATYTGLAIDSTGRIYAGNSATGQIFRYLADGTQGSLFADVLKATGSEEIDALAMDSASNVYVAQGGSNRIAVFDSTGAFQPPLLTNSGFNRNTSVYFNPNDGLLYAGNQADDGLTILTTAGAPVTVVHMGGQTVGVPDVAPAAPSPAPGQMETTQTGFTFQTPQGGSAPPPQSFAVVNHTAAALTFSTKISYTVPGSWLSVSGGGGAVAAGQTSASVTVSVNPSGLAESAYYGLIEIDAAGVPNSPQYVLVVLNVLAASANPGASVTPTGMIFTAVVNGANPAAQAVAVSDVLTRSTSFTATIAATTIPSWFTVSPSQGVVQPGQTVSLQVQPGVANLPAGVYSGTLTLQFPQDSVTRQIALSLVVVTSATEVAQDKFAPRQAAIQCQPTQLLIVFTNVGNYFTLPAGWPNQLQAFAVDDCGVPMVNGNVTVSYLDTGSPVTLTSQGAGNWSATWPPPSATTPTSLTLTATATYGKLKQGSTQIGGTVQPNPNAPPGVSDMVNAASYLPIGVSPGELVAVFGENLYPPNETWTANQTPLPTSVSNPNTFLLMGNEEIPLLYVGTSQINAVVPWDLKVGNHGEIVARSGNSLSVPQTAPVVGFAPAIFTTNSGGTGQGDILDLSYRLADSSNPVAAGSYVQIYCTGLGAVTNQPQTGSPAPSGLTGHPLAETTTMPTVTFNGVQSPSVLFSGLAPGFVGLYQVDAQVPALSLTGPTAVTVVLSIGGVPSNPVTMFVQ